MKGREAAGFGVIALLPDILFLLPVGLPQALLGGGAGPDFPFGRIFPYEIAFFNFLFTFTFPDNAAEFTSTLPGRLLGLKLGDDFMIVGLSYSATREAVPYPLPPNAFLLTDFFDFGLSGL